MASVKAVYVVKLKSKPTVPIDSRNISPDKFAGRSLSDIKLLKVLEGGKEVVLEELFDLEGPATVVKEPGEIEIVVAGPGTDKLKYLGYRMSNGKIVVKGSVGHLAGYKMSGGSIVIEGRAGSYLGAKMKGGTIEVFGDVGDFAGGKLQGEKPGKGMSGGTIVIHGNAGSQIGVGMSKGTIIVEGNARLLVGAFMTGGSILVQGSCGGFTGARMTGGKIVIGGTIEGILPSFYVDSMVSSAGVKGRTISKQFMVFIGDALVDGKGMLYVAYEDNKLLLEQYKELVEVALIE